MAFLIITDNTTDLPLSYIDDHGLEVLTLPIILDGVTYDDYRLVDSKIFFERMRENAMPITSQVNPEEAKKMFLSKIEKYKEILCLAFSSGLSGTYNSLRLAAEEVMEEHTDVKIIVIDTLCASLGEGLLVHRTLEQQAMGKSIDEVAKFVEDTKMNIVHVLTVDDLNHLHRGGRVSKTTAVIGTLANIKPIIHVDNAGCLINIDKVRGRKKSLHALVDLMEQKMGSYQTKNDIVMISHGDSPEDARYLADLIKEKFGITEFIINCLGATIGAHTGPGLISLFFMGDER